MCVPPVLRFASSYSRRPVMSAFFFFNDTATTEIYTLSLHDALPISFFRLLLVLCVQFIQREFQICRRSHANLLRSEEHTSELQSPDHLVCRLLLEKKKITMHKARRPLHGYIRRYTSSRARSLSQ